MVRPKPDRPQFSNEFCFFNLQSKERKDLGHESGPSVLGFFMLFESWVFSIWLLFRFLKHQLHHKGGFAYLVRDPPPDLPAIVAVLPQKVRYYCHLIPTCFSLFFTRRMTWVIIGLLKVLFGGLRSKKKPGSMFMRYRSRNCLIMYFYFNGETWELN